VRSSSIAADEEIPSARSSWLPAAMGSNLIRMPVDGTLGETWKQNMMGRVIPPNVSQHRSYIDTCQLSIIVSYGMLSSFMWKFFTLLVADD
jgi:hypothetical protein